MHADEKTDSPKPVRCGDLASERLCFLEQRVVEQDEWMRQRAETWREAVHDLRGMLGVTKNSLTVLNESSVSKHLRDEFMTMLQGSVAAMHVMLGDLMDLASLEARRERCKSKTFDAAALLKEVCEEFQASKGDHGIRVTATNSTPMTVEGDSGKVRRIVDSLLRIAEQSIGSGTVTVTCAEIAASQWTLCVRYSGDRVQEQLASPYEGRDAKPDSARVLIARSIVRALCDLLGARLEQEGDMGKGSAFLVMFPRSYDSVPTNG
jgi:signal transduction histidine kinase